MPDTEELLDEKEAVRRLNAALGLQYRSALQYSIAAATLTGIVSFGGKPTVEVAKPKHQAKPDKAIQWLVECEEEAIEALQEAIEPTGREGRSEALEHLLEHQIMRKQGQVDILTRALAA